MPPSKWPPDLHRAWAGGLQQTPSLAIHGCQSARPEGDVFTHTHTHTHTLTHTHTHTHTHAHTAIERPLDSSLVFKRNEICCIFQ